jgi:hypothetical protein
MKMGFRRRTCRWLVVVGSLALMSSFATTAAFASEPPSIDKESVSGITSTNAILETQVSPHGGFGAYVQFQLVIDPEEYLPAIFCPYPPPESTPLCLGEYAEGALVILRLFKEPHQVSLNLTKHAGVTLTPNTTYHYRVLAARAIPSEDTIEWEEPTVFGADQTFTTLGALFPLTVAKTGEGTVASSPAGIECTGAKTGAECQGEFEDGQLVTLTASPAAGYAFGAWSGCLEHAGLTCKVLMDKAKTVKATFIETPSLTVEKAGSGFGKAIATGISCDESCSKETAAVKTGTAVTVKVTPAKGNEFATFEGGTGNAASCAATCTFTISEASSVKVKFSPIPTKTLTVKLKGPGAYKGKVTGKGVTVKGVYSTAISCGSGCTTETETFFATGETELVAAASTGYAFKGWTVSGGSAGTCTGTTTPCKLLTDADKTVEAEFE